MLAPEMPSWHLLIALLAVATMTLGNLAALRQRDLRRLLGWSSVSQSGYALVGVALVGVADGAPAALLFFLAGYAAANVAAFAVVTELRGRTALADYRGLATERPGIAAVLAVSLLSLVGIPPLAGFVGKTLLMLAALDAGYAWLAAAVVVNSVLSLYYYLQVLAPIYFDRAPQSIPVLGRYAAVGVGAAGLLVVALGLAAGAALWSMERATVLP